MNRELPDVQAGFRKGRGTRDQIANIIESLKTQENIRKTTTSNYWLCQSLWLWGSQQTVEKKGWEYQTTWPASWEICVQVRKQQLELDMEQQTGSKLGKEYIKSVYCHPAYLTYMHSTYGLYEAQTGIKIAGRNINNLRYADDTSLMAENEELQSLLMKVKEESEKVGLKLNMQKTKIMASGPITSWQIDGETVETVADFIFLGSKITADGDSSHENKGHLLLGRKLWQT